MVFSCLAYSVVFRVCMMLADRKKMSNLSQSNQVFRVRPASATIHEGVTCFHDGMRYVDTGR